MNIDPTILSDQTGSQILNYMSTLGVEVNIKNQPIPEIISWSRSLSQELSADRTV